MLRFDSYLGVGLVVIEADGRTLTLVGRSHQRVLVRAPERIAEVVLSADSSRLAYSTVSGSVVIVRLPDCVRLATIEPGEVR